MVEEFVPSNANELNNVAASTSTRVSPTSSGVRYEVRMKKVVTKPMATPIYVAMVPLMLCLAMIPIVICMLQTIINMAQLLRN